jgi:hypothetical protein
MPVDFRPIPLLAAVCGLLAAFTAARGAAPAPPAAGLDLREVCDVASVLTPIGVDTDAGEILFTLPSRQPPIPGWVVVLETGSGAARLFADREREVRFGGSVGPGPVLASRRCGPSCLQMLRWREGLWEPVGGPLTLADTMTVHATYDHGGTPWVVLHRRAGEAAVDGWAFRLEGQEWSARGALRISAVGVPGAVPAPGRTDAVLSGTGLWAGAAPPGYWLAGLPAVAAGERGQVVSLGGPYGTYLAGGGGIYLTADAGRSWKASTWAPWGERGSLWRYGDEYTLDLALGDHAGALAVAWFDQRLPRKEAVVLAEKPAAGEWKEVGRLPLELSVAGAVLPFHHVLRTDREWVLVAGCVSTPAGAALALRTSRDGRLSAPRATLLRPAWLPGAPAETARPRGSRNGGDAGRPEAR